MDATQHAVHIHIHKVGPRIGVAIDHGAGNVDAGVGKQHIDAAKVRNCLVDQRYYIGTGGDIGGHSQRVRAQRLSQRRELFGRASGQHDFASHLHQCVCRCRANARAGAGDEDDFAGEWMIHVGVGLVIH